MSGRMRYLAAIAMVVLLFTMQAQSAAPRVRGAELVVPGADFEDVAAGLAGKPLYKSEVELLLGAVSHIERWALANIGQWTDAAGSKDVLKDMAALGLWKTAPITFEEYLAIVGKLGYARSIDRGELKAETLAQAVKTWNDLLASEFTKEEDKPEMKKQLARAETLLAAVENYPASNLQLYRDNRERIDKAIKRIDMLNIRLAAKDDNVQRVAELLDLGADVNAPGRYGWTVLMWAAASGSADMAKLAMQRGANINMRSAYGQTALWLATDSQSLEVVQMLLDAGANLNAKDNGLGHTALHTAVYKGNTDLARLLLEGGANVNVLSSSGESPVVMAANKGNREMAELLRQYGANPNMRDRLGTSPIEGALRLNKLEAVRILVSVGADLEERDPKYGQTLLIQQALLEGPEQVKLLLELGADPNARDNSGRTALDMAVSMGKPEVARALLDGGADPDIADDKGWTPLMYAVSEGKAQMARMLVEAGADTEHASPNGVTARGIAEYYGHSDLAGLFQPYEYLGCFKDQGNPFFGGRDIGGYTTNNSSMTVEQCVSLCDQKGFKYAGVQYSKHCFCGNSYGSLGKADNCDMACAGDKSEICGGYWANSVYAVKGKAQKPSSGRPSVTWNALRGDWSLEDNVLKQSSLTAKPALAVAKGYDLSSLTLSVRARKTAGKEGFLIVFRYKNDNRWLWWNLGGWGNSKSAIEHDTWGLGRIVRNTTTSNRIETGRWYDIKIEVNGRDFRGYIDGTPVLETVLPDNLSPSGSFGFATWNTAAEFSDIYFEQK